MFTILVDDEPYWTRGELSPFSGSPSLCVGHELSLNAGQTVKVMNRLSSYVYEEDTADNPAILYGILCNNPKLRTK